MRKISLYIILICPLFASGDVSTLRAILEEDLKVHIKINELKKEQKAIATEIEFAMQNTKALIDLYEQKTEQALKENKEQDFKKSIALAEIDALSANLLKLEGNIEKIYASFKENLEKVPVKLRDIYKFEIAKLENISYPNSTKESLAKLEFLKQVALDSKTYKRIDANTVTFGLNAEFYKDGTDADIAKLFKILDGEASYEILELEIEKALK